MAWARSPLRVGMHNTVLYEVVAALDEAELNLQERQSWASTSGQPTASMVKFRLGTFKVSFTVNCKNKIYSATVFINGAY